MRVTFINRSKRVNLDGNLTNDGRWTYAWDAENRLTQVESLSSSPTASKRKVVWEYDGQGRRIRQTTHDLSSGDVVTEDLKLVSDGWRHIAELNATNNALVRSYVWGLDLSGTLDGAGGVGGLLMINSAANGVHFYAYDGNGNVAALVKASDATVSENCEYDPFGKIIRNTGLMADENRFLFSTKRCDRTTDFELYEYRVRHPELTWLSRDPLGEKGGLNLYGFVLNSPLNFVDRLGEDYYITTAPAFCAIKHRYMVGDDGNGGHYVIDLAPNVERWYQHYRRFCGEGVITVRRGLGSAKDATSGYDSIERTVKTTTNMDKELSTAAGSLNDQKITYCLLLRDCRDIDRCVKTRNFVIKAAKKIADFFAKYEIQIGSD